MILERVPGDLTAGLELEPQEVRLGPGEPPEALVALRVRKLLKPADHLRMPEVARIIFVERIALLAAGQTDELDRSTKERSGDVAAELEGLGRIVFHKAVVVHRLASRDDMVELVKD